MPDYMQVKWDGFPAHMQCERERERESIDQSTVPLLSSLYNNKIQS